MTGESFGPKGTVTGDCIGCRVIFPLKSSSLGDVTLESTTVNSDSQEEKNFSPNTSPPSEEEVSKEGDDLSDSDKEDLSEKQSICVSCFIIRSFDTRSNRYSSHVDQDVQEEVVKLSKNIFLRQNLELSQHLSDFSCHIHLLPQTSFLLRFKDNMAKSIEWQ